MPLLSIIIPAYNAADFIEATLESIYAQTFTDYEIIVVDDGSTDGTSQALLRHKDKITYIRQPNSGAPASPRNLAMKLSDAKYIAIFDADDLMSSRKLEVAINLLEEQPDVALFFSNFKFMRQGKLDAQSFFDDPKVRQVLDSVPKRELQAGCFRFERPVPLEILKNNFIGTSTVVARREALVPQGLFNERLIGIEDRDLWYRLGKQGKLFGYSTEVLSTYRYHPGGISRQAKTLQSHIGYYERLVTEENDPDYIAVIRRRLGRLYFGYGYTLKNNKEFSEARRQYMKSFSIGNFKQKGKALLALAKCLISSLKI